MTDEQIKRAVAECAGWEWDEKARCAIERHENALLYQDEGTEVYRLKTNLIPLDDVVAACEAAGLPAWLRLDLNLSPRGAVWDRSGVFHEGVDSRPAKALALALIEACGVEVEDD